MLAKEYRLPIQYLSTRKVESSKRTPILTIKIFKSDLPHARFGVIISKKINKIAPKRNLLKRSVFNFIQPLLKDINPADYLIIINKSGVEKEELINELKNVQYFICSTVI